MNRRTFRWVRRKTTARVVLPNDDPVQIRGRGVSSGDVPDCDRRRSRQVVETGTTVSPSRFTEPFHRAGVPMQIGGYRT